MMGYITDVVLVPSQLEFEVLRHLIIKEKSTIASPIKCVMEPKKDSIMLLDYENFAAVFLQSGFGTVATSRSAYSVIREYMTKLERVFMVGTAYSKTYGLFRVEKTFQEYDLKLFDYEIGETPDQPLYYRADVDKFDDLPIANSLTVNHAVGSFPDVSEYKGLNENTPIINHEDYQFLASFYGMPVKKYILRSVLGPSYQFCENDTITKCMNDIWGVLRKEFDRE